MARKKKYKGKSPEEKRAEVKALLGDLKEGVENLVNSEEWTKWLGFRSKFHSYSFRNTLLIGFQCPSATQVAGYQAWKKLGRQVRKGEKGIRILAPSGVARFKKEVTNSAGEVEEKEYSFTRFRAVSIFDVSQTDGDELPKAPGSCKLEGEDGGLIEVLKVYSEANGCPVVFKPIEGGAHGAYYPLEHRIEVDSTNPQAQQAKTLAHEIGHSLLHKGMLATTVARDDKELEAESVAFIVCKHFGLETAEYSFSYLAHWKGKGADKAFAESAKRICDTANTIIEALETKASETLAEAA